MKKEETHDEQDTHVKFLVLTPKALSGQSITERIADQEQSDNNEPGLYTTTQREVAEKGEEEKNTDPNEKEYRDSVEDYGSPDYLKAPDEIVNLETALNLDSSVLNDHQGIKDDQSEVEKETLSLSKVYEVETNG